MFARCITISRMWPKSASHRLKVLQSQVKLPQLHLVRCKADRKVTVGGVTMKVYEATNPALVPTKYLPEELSQSVLQHLKWMMQKDLLGQDIFLIGPPGPLRRNLACMYLELTQREAEYLSLSRDTTEADLKQRREIINGTAHFIDQCAVRAAVEGRVLILEGIEKAERNVLPVLNNLLENREMQLEDGRFLMKADTYDKLLQTNSQGELDKWNLVRVSERFRVIALGLPVPRYQGNPLDPPLRSRFQSREVREPPFKDQLAALTALHPEAGDKVADILSYSMTLLQQDAIDLGLPDFPVYNLQSIVRVLNKFPDTSLSDLLGLLYPYTTFLGPEGQQAVEDALKKFNIPASSNRMLQSLGPAQTIAEHRGELKFSTANADPIVAEVSMGDSPHSTTSVQQYVRSEYQEGVLAQLLQSHTVQDMCIIGPKGCGKSMVAQRFADTLSYQLEPIMLYEDMTSRDLLLQRTTLPSGDTAWRPSPLVSAARLGKMAVLDGLHRVNPGTLSVIARLIQDREISLSDGSCLLRHDRFDAVKEKMGLSDEDLISRNVFRIHPSFRIMALAETPVVGGSSGQWMTSEMLSLFMYHELKPLSAPEEKRVVGESVPSSSSANMDKLFDLTQTLRNSKDPMSKAVASSLSTRQLLRIGRRLGRFPEDNLHEIIHRACLSRFLPKLAKETLDQTLSKVGITPPVTDGPQASAEGQDRSLTCEVSDGLLRIGSVSAPVFKSENATKIPDTLFYENALHLSILETMLKDFLLGEHLLLVGNQGVGKNKLVDRFLQLLGRPREYLQLHRDTTVQTLTLQSTVRGGVITYEDSPLVKAIKQGLVLVIDEADKAPTNVTCILKVLVENGQMHLADGRKIISGSASPSNHEDASKVIRAHPDFRMIVLANRPGFPFMGNDFFASLGDIFSCHAVDNPDVASEIAMLRRYGPDVSESILRKLVMAFGDLRSMADQGLIAYPYSTREVVNIVKHLQEFPGEGLTSVVRNVFDFDSHDKEVSEVLIETLHKHGIPVGASPTNIHLGKE